MASKARQRSGALTSEDIAESLDDLQKQLDRCKVMYEQFFMGIQKIPPAQLHRDLERKMRDLTQLNIRNTALRFRFTTMSQKFASYNSYWKRTLREIENGTYIKNIAKVGRDAARSGKDIPEELLAKMPKRMRDRILRDRDAVARRAEREQEREDAMRATGKVRNPQAGNVHQLDESDLLGDVDLDAIFSGITGGEGTGGSLFGSSSGNEFLRQEDTIETPQAARLSSDFSKDDDTEPNARPPVMRQPPRVHRSPAQKAPTPASSVAPPPGMSTSEAQALFQQYKKARELVGENTSNLSYDKLMTSLNKQAPKILEQSKASGVTFNVVVKGDKVVLKAKPKK